MRKKQKWVRHGFDPKGVRRLLRRFADTQCLGVQATDVMLASVAQLVRRLRPTVRCFSLPPLAFSCPPPPLIYLLIILGVQISPAEI